MFRNEDGTVDMAEILGIVMVVSGIYVLGCMAYFVAPYYELLLERFSIQEMSSVFLLIFGGLAVLIGRSMEYSSRIAIGGITIGATFLIRNFDFTEFYGQYISFIVPIIAFILGVLTVAASTALLCRYPFYVSRLVPSIGLMIAIECIPMYQMYREYVSLSDMLITCSASFGYIAVSAMMILALSNKETWVPSVYKSIEANMKIMKDVVYSDAETYITPEDLSELERTVRSGSEGKLDIRLRSRKSSRMLSLECCEGSAPRASIVAEYGRSFLEGFSMDVCALIPEDGRVTIYGRNGVFIRIMVHPEPEKPDIKGRIPFVSDLKRDPEEEAKE